MSPCRTPFELDDSGLSEPNECLCKVVNVLEGTDVDGFNTLFLKCCYNFGNFNRVECFVVVDKSKGESPVMLFSFLNQWVNFEQMVGGRESSSEKPARPRG